MRKRNNRYPPLLIDKSPYLKKLENRKIEKIIQIEEDKANYLLNKVLGRDNVFIRDYSVFFQCSIPSHSSFQTNKFSVYNPGLKLNLKSQTEELYPNKYINKSVPTDKFAMIYKNHPKTNQHLTLKSSSISSAGASIVKASAKKAPPYVLIERINTEK